MTIYTFERFWTTFHLFNKGRKTDKDNCRTLFERCNFEAKKRSAILECKGATQTAYEYLKLKLN